MQFPRRFSRASALIIETPILWSCYSGQYEFFKWLLSEKAEVRIVSENITTCLIGACLGPEASRAVLVKHILQLFVPLTLTPLQIPKTARHSRRRRPDRAARRRLRRQHRLRETPPRRRCGLHAARRRGSDALAGRIPAGCEWQQAEKSCYPECAEVLEAKWKELEDRAREEMEELLRMEGFDPKEWGLGKGNERKDGEKGEKGEEKGEEAGEGGGDGGEYGASGVSVRSVSEWEGNRGDSLLV